MKTILFFLSVFGSLTVFSQSDSASARKINFGLSITPEFNNLILGNPVGQESVKSKIGFSAGISFKFHLTNKSSFITGIGFGKKNYNHTHCGLIYGTDIDPLIGIISESKIESKVSFSELQIPLVFQYELKTNKFYIAGGLELIYRFLNNSERIIYYGNGAIAKLSNSNINGLNFAPELSFGYKLPVSDKLSISIEPMFKYYLKEYIIIESNLYNYGLKTTLNF